MDFFSILLPGALLTDLLMDNVGPVVLGDRYAKLADEPTAQALNSLIKEWELARATHQVSQELLRVAEQKRDSLDRINKPRTDHIARGV